MASVPYCQFRSHFSRPFKAAFLLDTALVNAVRITALRDRKRSLRVNFAVDVINAAVEKSSKDTYSVLTVHNEGMILVGDIVTSYRPLACIVVFTTQCTIRELELFRK